MENSGFQDLVSSGVLYTLLTPTTIFDSGNITYNAGVFTLNEAGLYGELRNKLWAECASHCTL